MAESWIDQHFNDTYRVTQAGRDEHESVIGTLRRWLEATGIQNVPGIIRDPYYGERAFDARMLEFISEAGDLGISVGEIWRRTTLLPDELEHTLGRLEQKGYIEMV